MKISGSKVILCSDFLDSSLTEPDDALPPYLIAGFEQRGDISVVNSNAVRSFEYLSLAARAHALYCTPPPAKWLTGKPMHEVDAAGVQKLLKFITEYNAGLSEEKRVSSFKLVGIKVCGDLDLSKIHFDFSIRIIGCWINGAILLDRTRLHTLDLSGSVITHGVSGNYMEAKGALRLRRTVFTGPADFGGAEIAATVDMSDAVFVPHNLPPPSVAYVGDRGMLNLSLAKVQKDVRFTRMRIYGGANLRGINIGGSLFMNDAHFRSPIACVERHLASKSGQVTDGALLSLLHADEDLATIIWRNEDSTDEKRIELLKGSYVDNPTFCAGPSARLLKKLLSESARAADCALRAEGAVIQGSVIGRSGRFAGRVRMKHVEIKGSLSLSGSRFRAPRSSKFQIESLIANLSDPKPMPQLIEAYKESQGNTDQCEESRENIDQREVSDRSEFVLDLQLSKIGGTLELENDSRNPSREAGHVELTTELIEQLCSTKENPIKFFPIFFCGSGDPYQQYYQIKEILDAEGKLTKRQKDASILYSKLEEIAQNTEPEFHERAVARTNLDSDSVLEKDIAALPKGERIESYVSQISSACYKFGNLNSTIINGEICLTEARINGSALFTGLIANAFGINQSTKPTVTLNNVYVGGDCDFRDSVGINSVKAEQADIRGSLHFSDEPVFGSSRTNRVDTPDTAISTSCQGEEIPETYSPGKDEWSPIRRRALFLVDHINSENVGSIGKHNFKRAKIGGNASFVFDPSAGPTLDLAYASITGKLTILPTRGGLDFTQTDYEGMVSQTPAPSRLLQDDASGRLRYRGIPHQASDEPIKKKRRLRPSIWLRARAGIETLRLFTGLGDLRSRTKGGPNNKIEQMSIRSIRQFESSTEPFIDLRNATCAVLAHPPTAWPKQERLIIEGLRYNQTRGMGPLVPFRRTVKELLQNKRHNAVGYLSVYVIGLMYVVPSLLILFSAKKFIETYIGLGNAVAGLVLIGALILTWGLRTTTRPKTKRANPMALQWLSLQRRYLNPRKVEMALHPLEPYSIAAATLRSAGRLRSANRVELQRLRHRANYVSKRTGLPLFLLLKLTDMVIEYGYAPIRAVFIASAFLIVGSTIGHNAAEKRQVTEADYDLLRVINGDDDVTAQIKSSSNQAQALNYPKFNPLAYTVDIFIPFLDLKQDSRWVILPAQRCSNNRSLGCVWSNFLPTYPFWWRVFGWVFSTIIAIAVVARVETIVARNEET